MKKMKKLSLPGRRILLIVLCAAVFAGTVVGLLFFLRGRSGSIPVYPVMQLATDYRWAQESETEGRVTTDRMQSVYVSPTQQITEFYVEEGDKVQAGDALMAFDTTLTDLELERQRITVQKLELDLENAWKQLNAVNTYQVYIPPAAQPEPEGGEQTLTPVSLPYRMPGGSGTAEDPWYFIWNERCSFDPIFVNGYLPPVPADYDAASTLLPSFSGVFEIRESDSPAGAILQSWMMTFTRTADGGYSFTIGDAPAPETDTDSGFGDMGFSMGGGAYSYNEILTMRMETQKKITDTELELKKARHKYEQLQYELTNGIIYAELDGVIKTVRDPEEARLENKPVLLLSGGGGYYVTGTLGELELSEMSIGDTVTVMSWESYEQMEATITDISQYPATGNSYHYSQGNQNISLYPFTVYLDEDAAVRDGEYVYITYYPGGESVNSLYLENPFILQENGKSYVYVADENGRLEKRQVNTGRSLWGSYTEITAGLSPEEYIAFPYGRNLRSGARTEVSTIEQLYAVYG